MNAPICSLCGTRLNTAHDWRACLGAQIAALTARVAILEGCTPGDSGVRVTATCRVCGEDCRPTRAYFASLEGRPYTCHECEDFLETPTAKRTAPDVDTEHIMLAAVDELKAGGLAASYEYPGYVAIDTWAFGIEGGQLVGNHSDGTAAEGLPENVALAGLPIAHAIGDFMAALVRVTCRNCGEEYTLPPAVLARREDVQGGTIQCCLSGRWVAPPSCPIASAPCSICGQSPDVHNVEACRREYEDGSETPTPLCSQCGGAFEDLVIAGGGGGAEDMAYCSVACYEAGEGVPYDVDKTTWATRLEGGKQ